MELLTVAIVDKEKSNHIISYRAYLLQGTSNNGSHHRLILATKDLDR